MIWFYLLNDNWTEVEKREHGTIIGNTWFTKNSFNLNKEKSVLILFALSNSNIPKQIIIKLHSNNCKNNNITDICNKNYCRYLSRVSSDKYLGLIFDESLKWKPHIEMVTMRFRKCFFYILRVTEYPRHF